jgi:hypothetical protein
MDLYLPSENLRYSYTGSRGNRFAKFTLGFKGENEIPLASSAEFDRHISVSKSRSQVERFLLREEPTTISASAGQSANRTTST